MQNSSIGIGIPKAVLIKFSPCGLRQFFVFFFSAPQNQFNLLIRPKIRINPFLHGQFVDFLDGHYAIYSKNPCSGQGFYKRKAPRSERGALSFLSVLVGRPVFKSRLLPLLVKLAVFFASLIVRNHQAETFFARNSPKDIKPEKTNPSKHSFTSLL